MLTVGLWLLNLLLDTTGQIAFKIAAGRPSVPGMAGWLGMLREPWIRFGVACYGAEFTTWLAFLTLTPLSTAVLLSSINVVTVALAGRILFGERADGLRVAGIVLVAAGVALAGAGAAGA